MWPRKSDRVEHTLPNATLGGRSFQQTIAVVSNKTKNVDIATELLGLL